jgi:hypothetical protein
MHEHLREVAAMGLILGLGEDDLCRPHDGAAWLFRREHDAFAARRTRRHAAPERLRFGPGHGQHEADGGATFHAVDQHVAQFLDLGVPHARQRANLDGIGHGHLLGARDRSLAITTM